MTQENKELLLKDLCARLPYNCRVFYEYVDDLDKKTYGYSLTLNTWCIDELCANKAIIKPYLRPLSSMTEEEEQIVRWFKSDILTQGVGAIDLYMNRYIEWLDSRHFDWRTDGNGKTLIENGLALEAPEGMYKIE